MQKALSVWSGVAILLFLIGLVLPALSPVANAQNITTIAGDGSATALNNPYGVATDGSGNVYIADTKHNRIRKVSTTGEISTVAGTSTAGYSGDGGPATLAKLNNPTGVAVDASGNLYIADMQNQRIRKVSVTGEISTVAGTGTPGYNGDSGPATSAQLNNPYSVAVDGNGDLYIADKSNNRIRKVGTVGVLGGLITTIAGTGSGGFSGDNGPATSAQVADLEGVTVDGSGNLYMVANNRIRKVNTSGSISTVAGNGDYGFIGDGGPATAARLNSPRGVAVDASGNLYIADFNSYRIRKVNMSGIISTVAGGGSGGDYVLATAAHLNKPTGVAVDGIGNFYILDTEYHLVRKVNTAGIISMLAGRDSGGFSGDGGPATSAQLNYPYSVAVDDSGNVFFADYANHRVRKVSTTGEISTVAGNGTFGFSGDGGPATAAQLYNPYSIAIDESGNLFIADLQNQRIRKVSTTGIITTVAGTGTFGYSGDGGPATSAQLNYPYGVAVDGSGNLYIADYSNHRIRKVSPSGIISTVAGNGSGGFSGDGSPATSAQLRNPTGVAADESENLYIADYNNRRIRKVSSAGLMSTVAGTGELGFSGDGGPATSAQLSSPTNVEVDSTGNLYIADLRNHRIRKVNTNGVINTVAGNAGPGYGGDGGTATDSRLLYPNDMVVGRDGTIYVADTNNHRVRKVYVVECPNMHTLKAGSWSDISVWSCGRVPVVTDVVTLNHVVSIPASYVGRVQQVIYGASGGLLLNTNGRLKMAVE